MLDEQLDTDGLPIRPLRRQEYDRMVELGMFEGEPIELLRGALVTMSPQGPLRSWTLLRVADVLRTCSTDRAMVRTQCPLALSDLDEPEPDVAVVAIGDYRFVHPTTALLVVEAAITSLAIDRKTKARVYALARIPEFWIVDPKGDCVHVYREPVAGAYTRIRALGRGETLDCVMLPGVLVAVDELLPWPGGDQPPKYVPPARSSSSVGPVGTHPYRARVSALDAETSSP